MLDLSVVLSMLIIIFPQEKGETDAYTQLSGILSTWEATQAELSEGEMDFKVVQQLANKKHVYTGVVGWQFPNIRWEYEERVESAGGTGTARVILIDTPTEVITFSLDTNHAYRSWNRCRTYDSMLRLAPWQLWFEYDGQLSFTKVLDEGKIRSDKDCVLTCSKRGEKLHINLKRSLTDFEMVFNASNGAILRYSSKANKEFQGVLRAGDFEWILIDQIPFPKRITLREWEPRKTSSAEPKVTIETSNQKRTLGRWQGKDFSYASLDKSKIDVMVEYFSDNRPPVTHTYRKRSENDVEKLRELGEAVSKLGFATGGN
ncbi:MAG: hypothetical protein SFV81_05355 [Pirellulaceae bacterium]|nr:hypothetical protein [Pirellulaceae bacterium]